MKMENIAVFIDEESREILGVYDVSEMTGEIVDFYDSDFYNLAEWEEDMLERGATFLMWDEYVF